MRILLVWPIPSPAIDVLIKGLTDEGHEIVYWVGYNSVSHLTPKGAIFHDHYDAWEGGRAPALENTPIEPTSASLIGRYHHIESIALSMMDKRYGDRNVYERKHVYYSMLAYWNFVLETYKPDAVIFATIPHSVYNYILYELARERGILTPCFEDTWIAGRLLFYQDFWHGSDEFRRALAQSKGAKLSDLPIDLREYYERFTKSEEQPAYMTLQKRTSTGFGKLLHRMRIAAKNLASGRTLLILWEHARLAFSENLSKEYSRFVSQVDGDEPFVYFPLHMQPERTTCPQGGVYNDQILIAETVAAALPEGWSLLVKEHPSQWWIRDKTRYSNARFRGYYERLARIPRVKLVPTFTNTFSLTRKSKAVVTVMGTAGWEALLRGVPVLIFGYPWYRDCGGVTSVSSVSECAAALEAVRIGVLRPTEKDIFAFLKALDTVGIRAFIDSIIGGAENISYTESLTEISRALNSYLRQRRVP